MITVLTLLAVAACLGPFSMGKLIFSYNQHHTRKQSGHHLCLLLIPLNQACFIQASGRNPDNSSDACLWLKHLAAESALLQHSSALWNRLTYFTDFIGFSKSCKFIHAFE